MQKDDLTITVTPESEQVSPSTNEKQEYKENASTYSNSVASGYDSNGKEEPKIESAGVHNAEIYTFAYGLDNSVRSTYQTLATSSYSKHSLLSTVTCIKKVVSAAAQIWFARSADMFGRTTK